MTILKKINSVFLKLLTFVLLISETAGKSCIYVLNFRLDIKCEKNVKKYLTEFKYFSYLYSVKYVKYF